MNSLTHKYRYTHIHILSPHFPQHSLFFLSNVVRSSQWVRAYQAGCNDSPPVWVSFFLNPTLSLTSIFSLPSPPPTHTHTQTVSSHTPTVTVLILVWLSRCFRTRRYFLFHCFAFYTSKMTRSALVCCRGGWRTIFLSGGSLYSGLRKVIMTLLGLLASL